MRQRRQHDRKRLAHGLRVAGQVDDQRRAAHSGHRAREHRRRNGGDRRGAHRLGDARDWIVETSPRSLAACGRAGRVPFRRSSRRARRARGRTGRSARPATPRDRRRARGCERSRTVARASARSPGCTRRSACRPRRRPKARGRGAERVSALAFHVPLLPPLLCTRRSDSIDDPAFERLRHVVDRQRRHRRCRHRFHLDARLRQRSARWPRSRAARVPPTRTRRRHSTAEASASAGSVSDVCFGGHDAGELRGDECIALRQRRRPQRVGRLRRHAGAARTRPRRVAVTRLWPHVDHLRLCRPAATWDGRRAVAIGPDLARRTATRRARAARGSRRGWRA